MPTGKIALRTIDQFMADYKPVYQPIYGLFLPKSKQYSAEAGKQTFTRVDTIGDIRAKHVTPKDTELHQIHAKEGQKTFKKYFLANQFQLSKFQDAQGIEDVFAQVLDEHQKHQDDLLLLGEGTSNSTMINNGLFWSGDANYRLENSLQISKSSTGYHAPDFYTQMLASAEVANTIAGKKVLIVYGSTAVAKYNALFSNSDAPFSRVLAEGLGADYSIVKMPSAVTPSGTNGWIIANLDQVMLHYTKLPGIESQGINEEKMYAWSNFLMGSMMLEVLVDDAIYRQPCTFEA